MFLGCFCRHTVKVFESVFLQSSMVRKITVELLKHAHVYNWSVPLIKQSIAAVLAYVTNLIILAINLAVIKIRLCCSVIRCAIVRITSDERDSSILVVRQFLVQSVDTKLRRLKI